MGVSLGLVGIVDKGIYNPDETYNKGNFVLHEGSTWLALKDNLQGVEPAEGESWKFLARGFAAEILSLITAVDSAGLVGNAGAETDGQTLLDAIADKVANQLLEKKMMSNVQVNDATMVPTSALVYAMQQALTNLNSDVVMRRRNISSSTNYDELTSPGFYHVNLWNGGSTGTNLPSEASNHKLGQLLALPTSDGTGISIQVYFSQDGIRYRAKNSDNIWQDWETIFEFER